MGGGKAKGESLRLQPGKGKLCSEESFPPGFSSDIPRSPYLAEEQPRGIFRRNTTESRLQKYSSSPVKQKFSPLAAPRMIQRAWCCEDPALWLPTQVRKDISSKAGSLLKQRAFENLDSHSKNPLINVCTLILWCRRAVPHFKKLCDFFFWQMLLP